ncbi:Peptidyl-prolyl cis-trans isomerase CWC27 like protein [Eufriesea mexicana]|uniref:Peptidyl-prolyl cis-trans isomerase n=1 Tax=Eufriesea mexicana TaxID=516756 RepID=A0A310SNQ4_9HYME|nr:Peptidyl-prolyl cis-trans isomerase CWC27 like protein [Eufriesea mexicana]
MRTTFGDVESELWAKETPKACRYFIQLCMEGYSDDTIFHRIIKRFITQAGDLTVDEFHSILRFRRRDLIAVANAGEDDNGFQFFFTLISTPDLQHKHTIFGKVEEYTIYDMLKVEEALVGENDRLLYPPRLLKSIILNKPFSVIISRTIVQESEEVKDSSKIKTAVENAKDKSAHSHLADPKLSSQPPVEPHGLAN